MIIRSPDVSWIQQERWDGLTSEQKEKFIPLAPDFVLELMSPTDYLVNNELPRPSKMMDEVSDASSRLVA